MESRRTWLTTRSMLQRTTVSRNAIQQVARSDAHQYMLSKPARMETNLQARAILQLTLTPVRLSPMTRATRAIVLLQSGGSCDHGPSGASRRNHF